MARATYRTAAKKAARRAKVNAIIRSKPNKHVGGIMGRSLYFLFVAMALVGCASTDITSFKDPAYAAKPRFNSVLVLTAGMSLGEKAAVEDAAVKEFSAKGTHAIHGMDIVPPTRQLNDEEFVQAIVRSGAQTLLIVFAGQKGTSQAYVPPVYHPGQVYGNATTVGNYTYFNAYQTPGYTTGGYSIALPQATYSAKLIESSTGKEVWQADGLSSGNEFADYNDLAQSMAQEAVDKLYEDKVF